MPLRLGRLVRPIVRASSLVLFLINVSKAGLGRRIHLNEIDGREGKLKKLTEGNNYGGNPKSYSISGKRVE